MGFMDKIKNLFTEEIEEEVPVKKEVIQVEIPAPVPPVRERVVKEANDITESEVLKKEEKFVFPVFFDDKDFDSLDHKREEVSVKPVKPVEPQRKAYRASQKEEKREEAKKRFKPTPIISPVYGVLEKNYRKEDIKVKQRSHSNYQKDVAISVDDVRKKAYGTLTDDLENTLLGEVPIPYEEPVEEKKETLDLFDEFDLDLRDTMEEAFIEVNDQTQEINLKEEDLKNEKKDIFDDDFFSLPDNMIEEELDKMYNAEEKEKDINESDLFHMIDSLYEKKGDE